MSLPEVPVVICTLTLERPPTAEEQQRFAAAFKAYVQSTLWAEDQTVYRSEVQHVVLGKDTFNLCFDIPEEKQQIVDITVEQDVLIKAARDRFVNAAIPEGITVRDVPYVTEEIKENK